MATHWGTGGCLRTALVAVALAAIGVPGGRALAQGNAVTLPPLKNTEWKIAHTGASLTIIGDSTRFELQTTGADMWMRVGRLWHVFDQGMEPGWSSSWPWPGGRTLPWQILRNNERYGSVSRKQGVMAGARNWVPPTSADSLKLWGFVTHSPPISPLLRQTHIINHAFRGVNAWGGIGGIDQVQVQRWVPPQVYVSGIQLHDQTATFPLTPGSPGGEDGPENFGIIRGVLDPQLPSHRVIYRHYRWQLGVDVREIVHAYATDDDGDYLLYDYAFTNTGVMSRRPIVTHPLPIQDFWFSFNFHARPSAQGMSLYGGDDDLLEFINPWPTYTDPSGNYHQMVMFYDGDRPGGFEDWSDPGYSDGLKLGVDLWSKQFTAVGWIFAEDTPGSGIDDPRQPEGTSWCQERDYNLGNLGNDMTRQYRTIFCGGQTDDVPRRYPDGVVGPSLGKKDPTPYQGIRWDQLAFGATARAVLVVAAGGLDDQTSRSMARAQITRKNAGITPIQTPGEIDLLMTSKDSVKRVLDRAFWNIYGYDPSPPGGTPRWLNKPSGQPAFHVPEPPPPPACAWMNPGFGSNIITWLPLSADEKKDSDTGVTDFAGYRVYRSIGSSDSDYVMVHDGPETQFEDKNVSKDFVYYYYVVSYDDGTQDWSRPTGQKRKMESFRFWLWNGWYDKGVRPAGTMAVAEADLANIRVVPNPYSVRLDFPEGAPQEEITWKNLPETCTIRIYTSAGIFVHELDHTYGEGGAEVWDMRTANNQYIATGVYIYTIDSEIGTHVGKFIVVR